MPNVEAPQPSPRTASPAVAAPANTGATEGLESEIQRLKEENSSMKRKHDKEVNQIKQVWTVRTDPFSCFHWFHSKILVSYFSLCRFMRFKCCWFSM